MACIDCKHHVRPESKPITVHGNGFISFENEIVPAHCGNGHPDVWAKWWADNGFKKSDVARLDVPECFEKTEHAERLDSLLTCIDRLGKLLEQ